MICIFLGSNSFGEFFSSFEHLIFFRDIILIFPQNVCKFFVVVEAFYYMISQQI